MATRKTADPKPAAKTATKSTAVATRASTNIVSIKENLQKMAGAMSERIAPATGNKIRVTQDKRFVLPDGQKSDGPLELVVVDFATVHQFFEGKYDPNNIVPPGCFAVGINPKQMFPLKESPNLQAEDCQTCPMNEFGSEGNGKACKNSRRLAVLPPDADADTPIWILDVSPTALKAFDGYVSAVVRMFGMPPISVVTTVGFDDSVDYPKLTFTDPKPNENLDVHYARQDEAKELIMAAPDFSGYKGAAPVRKAPVRKAAPARR